MNKYTLLNKLIQEGIDVEDILDQVIDMLDNAEAINILQEAANNMGVFGVLDDDSLDEDDWNTPEYNEDYDD